MSSAKNGSATVTRALDEWVRTVTEPRVRPLQGKTRAFAEDSVRAARALEKRGEELIARTRRDLFGLGDARKSSSAMALMRICKEASSACQDFYKQEWSGMPLSRIESGIDRLCKTLAECYNTSGRLAAKHFRSEAFSLSGEIDTLRNISRQVSQFEARTRETMAAYDSIREQASLVGEQLAALDRLSASRIEVEREAGEAESRMKSLQEKISQVGKSPGIESLDMAEGELRSLRRSLLQEEMSRLSGLLERFSTLIQRGEAEQPREVANVLNGYLETPLTSLARERDGYPKLADALAGLLKAAETNKLGISEKKARKGLERARKVVDGSLLSIQKEARKAFSARARLLRLETVKRLRAERLELRGEYLKLADSRKQLTLKITRVQEEIHAGQAQTANRLGRIEKLAEEWFGKKMPQALRDQTLAASRS